MKSKTRYFQNCLGVFQGGGCKGIAYVGAYKECVERGVSFSEIVGASAGAIVAVFVAAGATPSQLEIIMGELNFKNFLKAPISLNIKKAPWAISKSSFLLPKKYKSYHSIITHLGIYDSSYIEEFINDNLKKILKTRHNPTFEDLLIPCSVVVSDLQNSDVKIFSTEKTPKSEVSKAVRMSANMPFFFQPIDYRYVDGGMLSNLPLYLYKGKESLHNKVLAFRLQSNESQIPIDNVEKYLNAIVNTSLSGNTNIQVSLSSSVNFIDIDTGDIKSTDFEKIDPEVSKFLIQQGREASSNFFDSEITNMNDSIVSPDLNISKNGTFNRITDTNNEVIEDVIIVATETKFIYDLFPTINKWVEDQAKVKVLLKENNDDPKHGPYRLRLMENLGFEVAFQKEIPFRGFLFNCNSNNSKSVILNSLEKEHRTFHSKFYHGKQDSDVIEALHQRVYTNFSNSKRSSKIKYEQVKTDEIIPLLKTVHQYASPQIEMSLERIDIENLTFLTKLINGFKFRQIHHLVNVFLTNEFELFKPLKMIFPNNKFTLITPPIVEKHGDEYFVIEGNTRLSYLYRNGYTYAYVIVIKNVTATLPSTGKYKANSILITDKEKIGEDRYESFNHDNYRYIEFAIRNPETCLI